MTHRIRIRRALVATLLLTTLLGVSPSVSASTQGSDGLHYASVSYKLCDIEWQKGRWFVKKLIRCAAHRYGINADRAIVIAHRESRFRPHAYNSWSCAKGVFQHLCRYWPGRAYSYGFAGFSAFNARANIIVSMRMVRRYGWSPWG